MEPGNSFYDLLKEEFRRKKNADVAISRKEEILKNVKSFVKYLIKPNCISKAIETISKIRDELEKGGCPAEFDMTHADFDLILLINAVVFCCGHKWDEAEELFYQLTEKYQESVFFILLGVVKNKRHIFRCSRDSLCLAQIASHTPEVFLGLNLSLTSLNEIEIKDSITKFLVYTKNMEEIPLNNYIKTNNIIEFNDVKTIGNIFRNDIFPIIKDQIDVFLRGNLPKDNNQVVINDQSTQTENINTATSSKGLQTELLKTINKSVQTLKLKDKVDQKKYKELATLRTTVDELKKKNSDLTKRLNETTSNLHAAQNKIYYLEDEIRESKENYMDQETTILEIAKSAFKSLYDLQKALSDQSKQKLQNIDAMTSALQSKFRVLGLEEDIYNLSRTNLHAAQNKIYYLEDEIRESKENYMDQETTILEIAKSAFKSLYDLQKTLSDQSKQKLQNIDAMTSALQSEFRVLGLEEDIYNLSRTVTYRQKEADHFNKLIDQRYNQILRLLQTNRFSELLSMTYGDYDFLEEPSLLLDLIAKLVTVCRNNRLTNQHYNNERDLNFLIDANLHDEATGGGNSSNDRDYYYFFGSETPPPRAASLGLDNLSNEDPIEMWVEAVEPYVEPSQEDFPPLSGLSRRQLKKIRARDEFYTFVVKIQSLLPRCTTMQIKQAIQAVQAQKNIVFREVKMEDIVEYLNSTVNDDSYEIPYIWDYKTNSGENTHVENPSCPICLEIMINISDRMSLVCGHLFHHECINEWLKTNGSCPICRISVRLNNE